MVRFILVWYTTKQSNTNRFFIFKFLATKCLRLWIDIIKKIDYN